ncbi:MAG: EF2563 family selenium-dependent molybdenum hydroxylase system protein [Lachnospiraceae bacterium]|nr:EF2563 family selenium-dependent molybdenum hydroxylase system protein [Lachnospiraceae bacterium]
MKEKTCVLIRGAGDLASGIALRLFHSGFMIVMTDLPEPTAIRRSVAFSEAIRKGECQVEEVRAFRAENAKEAIELIRKGFIAVVPDPGKEIIKALKPAVVVDAILAKKNLGTLITDAPVVIGVGPGFTAGADCHAVIETKRGHTLGRVILKGSAIPNTGIPGIISGFGAERVLRSPAEGVFRPLKEIGDIVRKGEEVARTGDAPLYATIDGMLRGLLPEGIYVTAGFKCGDIDPRGEEADFTTVSDKALSVGGGVLEAILRFMP